jgi:hypothetical protein
MTQLAAPVPSRLLPVLTFAAIFVPGHMFGWIVEWTWLAIMVAFCGITIGIRKWQGEAMGVSVQLWALMFACLCGVSALSFAITLLRGKAINERDVAEMLRFPIYTLMICFFAVRIGRGEFSGINRVTRAAIIYALVCAAAYQFKIPGLFPAVELLYSEAKVLFGVGVVRVPFPFENPNFLAYFLILALAYFCFLRRSIPFMLLTLALLFLTGSRSGWLAGLAVLSCFALADIIGPSLFRRTLSLSILALVIAGALIYWEQLTSFARVAELVNALQGGDLGGVQTARIRLDAVAYMLDWVEISPLVGWGPGRALEFDVADNQYLSWIMAWGLIGLALIVTIGVIVALHLLSVAYGRVNKLGVLGLLGGIAAMLATGDFLENYRLFFLTLVYIHVFYETLRNERERATSAATPLTAPTRLGLSTP